MSNLQSSDFRLQGLRNGEMGSFLRCVDMDVGMGLVS